MTNRTLFFKNCLGVFQGGGCRAAAFAGAYRVAIERGAHFSEVAGTSAGSIAAVFIAAGATPEQMAKFLEGLDFIKLLAPPPVEGASGWLKRTPLAGKYAAMYCDLGIYSSRKLEQWVDDCLHELLPDVTRPVRFKALQIPTWIVAADLHAQAPVIWSKKENADYFVAKAVAASCSIPLFFQPMDKQYVDGGLVSNLPSFVFRRRDATDQPMASRILAFVLKADDTVFKETGLRELLANTIVDANSSVQMMLQEEVSVLEIGTGAIRATDFDKITKEQVKTLVSSGEAAAREFFDKEQIHVRTQRPRASVYCGREELLAAVTLFTHRTSEILISEFDTEFVYDLFPTLVDWRNNGKSIQVLIPKYMQKRDHGAYQRRLLECIGAQVVEVENIPVRAYIYNPSSPSQAIAFVDVPAEGSVKSTDAVKYEGPTDAAVIKAIVESIRACIPSGPALSTFQPTLSLGGAQLLFERLKKVPQYQGASVRMAVRDIELNSLMSIVHSVREYKYRQIETLARLYESSGLPVKLFEGVVVNLQDGKQSIVTPIIVEKAGDGYVLIKGTTRAVYCRDNLRNDGTQIKSIPCVVVSNVGDPLPANGTVPLNRVRMVGKTLSDVGDRYVGGVLILQNLRPIERYVHDTDGP